MSDVQSLAHTKWNCKYHVVFAPKYRRQVFYGEKKRGIGEILRRLCEWKGVTILEAECCPDHVHMLLEIPPKMSVSGLRRDSATVIMDRARTQRVCWMASCGYGITGLMGLRMSFLQKKGKAPDISEGLPLAS